MDKFTKVIVVLVLFVVAGTSAPAAERKVEVGMTPSPVYGLWSNINKAVIAYARLHTTDEDWLKKLEDMETNKFSDKNPAGVLEQVVRFHTNLNELRNHQEDIVLDILHAGDLPNLLSSIDGHITPSQVYLHSSQVLINLAEDILYASTDAVVISPFFKENNFTDKTPSDVFGLVDLALRRCDEIIARKETGELLIKSELLIKDRSK